MRAVNLMVLRTRAVLFAGFTFVVFTLRSDVARILMRTAPVANYIIENIVPALWTLPLGCRLAAQNAAMARAHIGRLSLLTMPVTLFLIRLLTNHGLNRHPNAQPAQLLTNKNPAPATMTFPCS